MELSRLYFPLSSFPRTSIHSFFQRCALAFGKEKLRNCTCKVRFCRLILTYIDDYVDKEHKAHFDKHLLFISELSEF